MKQKKQKNPCFDNVNKYACMLYVYIYYENDIYIYIYIYIYE